MREEFGISRMLEIQDQLQAKYAGKWEKICPETARNKLMWAIGEMGEVIQIFKKRGESEIMDNAEVRERFVEEMADVYMYMADVLNCLGITAEEFASVYEKKHAHNMKRDYVTENRRMFDAPEGENA